MFFLNCKYSLTSVDSSVGECTDTKLNMSRKLRHFKCAADVMSFATENLMSYVFKLCHLQQQIHSSARNICENVTLL